MLGIHVAGLGLQHEADVLGRFVADVGQHRQLLLFEQRRDLLDQPPFLHLIGDFGDDDAPGAVAQRLLRPARAQRGSRRGRSRRRAQMACAGSTSTPPVGKSGPGTCASSSSTSRLGSSIRCMAARRTTRRRCAAGSRSPCRPRCPTRRWPAGSGKRAGRTTGSLVLAVIGGAEIDRVLVDAVQQRLGHLGQPASV